MTITSQDTFADVVLAKAALRRVLPEYLAAVAKIRSGISDGPAATGVGPFGIIQADWDAALADPDLSADPFKITRWRDQVSVFAIMTSKAQAALALKLKRNFSMEELYAEQFPNDSVNPLAQALQDIAPIITGALNRAQIEADPTILDSAGNLIGEGAGGILGELVGKIESKGDYNAFNRGTAGVSTGGPINLVSMTIGEIRAKQALAGSARLFAVGKYQVVPLTMKETVQKLNIQDGDLYAALLQEAMFRKHLVGEKRRTLKHYIMGKNSDLDGAQTDLANEFASVPKPGGGSAHAGVGGNAALTSSATTRAAINAERDRFKVLIASGKSEDDAWLALSPGLA